VFSLADQPLDFGTTKACVRRGRLMVSTDSGPRHMAAALGRPVITLFGPMLPVWSENPTVRSVNLCLDLECIGCGKRVCPLGHHRCMKGITPDMVYAEVVKLAEDHGEGDLLPQRPEGCFAQ
jgi:heptosyltransferase-2